MADNVNVGGNTYGTDDVGGIHYQRVKPVVGPDGTATDVSTATPMPVSASSAYVELTGNHTGAGQTIIASTDVRGFTSVIVHATGASNQSNVQFSNDNTNWVTVTGAAMGLQGNLTTSIVTTWSPTVYPVLGRYMRVQSASYSSGTTVITAELSVAPPPVMPVASLSGNGLAVGVGNGMNSASDNIGAAYTLLPSAAVGMRFNGSTFDRLRHPTTFKTVTATASGSTALWTPTSGKKFRLMRYRVEVTNSATAASPGDMDIIFKDASTSMAAAHSVSIPSSAAGGIGSWDSGWIDLGNGILSAAANNVLNVDLSFALTAGKVRVMCAGTEE